MSLTDLVKIWELLQAKDTTENQLFGRLGELYYCDLKNAVSEVVGVVNDIVPGFPIDSSELAELRRKK